MIKWNFLLVALFAFHISNTQTIILGKKGSLLSKLSEISGMIKCDGKFYALNDGGNSSEIHEIDTQSGNVIRSIKIKSANIDWEELASDDTSIFIGDFGNNKGNRKNLQILKFNKSELSKDSIVPEVINFDYNDQIDFSSRDFHNFDCEAMIPEGNGLYLFTKNRLDLKCNLYFVPKSTGTYSLKKLDSIGLNYMITGASLNPKGGLLLCGYDYSLNYYVSVLHNWSTLNRIKGKVSTKMFDDEPMQFESILALNDSAFLMAAESLSSKPAVLVSGKINYNVLSIGMLGLEILNVYPNEFVTKVTVNYNKNVSALVVLNAIGDKVFETKTKLNKDSMTVDLSFLAPGQYCLAFKSKNKVLKVLRIEKI